MGYYANEPSRSKPFAGALKPSSLRGDETKATKPASKSTYLVSYPSANPISLSARKLTTGSYIEQARIERVREEFELGRFLLSGASVGKRNPRL